MYVDIVYIKDSESIKVVERVDGVRVFKDYKPDYHFFINDTTGKYTTIYGNPVKKLVPKSREELHQLKRAFRKSPMWESDIRPAYRCLEQEYLGAEPPKMNVAFFDIETDFDAIRGYSTPAEAFNPITSISVYLQWLDKMVCIAVPPPTITMEKAEEIAAAVGNVIIVNTETEMLDIFLSLIEDADVLSGWNSELYDIPYIVNRVTKLMGKLHARRLCLWNMLPERRTTEFGGAEQEIYSLVGRIHLDYMKLYKNFNTEERRSYALDRIAEDEELGEGKVKYAGTLDQLYKQEFKLFLEYNIQDTKLLDLIDKKLQYISLANSMAHVNCIPIPAVTGAVGMTEQAIILEAHRLNLVVQDKKEIEEDTGDSILHKAAGGWVSHPKIGIHRWVGAVDLNSLYPSVIRALNMSSETIVGQIRTDDTIRAINDWIALGGTKHTFAEWWNDRFSTLEMENYFTNNKSNILHLDMEDGSSFELTGAELRKLVFESGKPWCISANGTIFDTSKVGVIPSLLGRWYNERKTMKKCMSMYESLVANEKVEGVVIPSELFTAADINYANFTEANCYNLDEAYNDKALRALITAGVKDDVVAYMNAHRLTVVNGKALYHDQQYIHTIVEYWDKRQHVRKILLNSLYGGLLNRAHRFFDQRLGQSTTLTGRNITKHMSASINQLFTGEYDHNGATAIYNDTDSFYFSAYEVMKPHVEAGEMVWSTENVIQLYDEVANATNATFSSFMLNTFNVPVSYGKVIAAGREIVAKTTLFIKKKRYAALVIDKEGTRQDVGGKPGKMKVTGLDLRRNDTVKEVQVFLMEILKLVLEDYTEDDVIAYINAFKQSYNETEPWLWGKPSKSNNLTNYMHKVEVELEKRLSGEGKTKGFTVPAQITGAIHWNAMREMNNDRETMKITDGTKISLCYLLQTADNSYKEICYPIDELRLPEWFTSLPFDREKMMKTALDKKVKNMIGILNWDLSRTSFANENFEKMFVFDPNDC